MPLFINSCFNIPKFERQKAEYKHPEPLGTDNSMEPVHGMRLHLAAVLRTVSVNLLPFIIDDISVARTWCQGLSRQEGGRSSNCGKQHGYLQPEVF